MQDDQGDPRNVPLPGSDHDFGDNLEADVSANAGATDDVLRAIQEEPADLSGKAALKYVSTILPLFACAVQWLALKEEGVVLVDDLLFFSNEEFGWISCVPVQYNNEGNIEKKRKHQIVGDPVGTFFCQTWNENHCLWCACGIVNR
jgi:hypothetical protein